MSVTELYQLNDWNKFPPPIEAPSYPHTRTHTHQFLHRDSSSPAAKLPPLTQPAPNKKYGGRSLYNYRQSQRVQGIVSGMV